MLTFSRLSEISSRWIAGVVAARILKSGWTVSTNNETGLARNLFKMGTQRRLRPFPHRGKGIRFDVE